jgi:hypothetical protein
MKDTSPINDAMFYENDPLMCQTFTDRAHKNFLRRLRRRGFVRSICGYVYFHPKHWKNAFMSFVRGDSGDTWIYEDALKARTNEAKKALKNYEDT